MEKRDESSVKITNAGMGKASAWKACIYLFISTYIYLTWDTDKEIFRNINVDDFKRSDIDVVSAT